MENRGHGRGFCGMVSPFRKAWTGANLFRLKKTQNEDKIFQKVKCLMNHRIQARWICSDSSVDADLGQETGDPQNTVTSGGQ